MISYGYCYTNGYGVNGYKQNGIVETEAQARKAIVEKLIAQNGPGRDITWQTRQDKTRAYVDGVPSNYIYFSVKSEIWIAMETAYPSDRVLFSGSLESVKRRVKNWIKKDHINNDTDNLPETCTFKGRGKTKTAYITYPGSNVLIDSDVKLVRVM